MSTVIDKAGRTKLAWPDFKKEALKIKSKVPKGSQWTTIVRNKLGIGHWEGKDWSLEADKGKIKRKSTDVKIKGKIKSGKSRNLQIEKNRPTQEVFDEAGKLWDELVGKKGKFKMGDKTFTSKKEYQEFEAKRHNNQTKGKEKLNRIGGKTHGHAVPPKHKYAVETYMQSFPEDAAKNYESQDKVPKDFSKRLDKADIPKTKTEVAKRHVGTADRITNPIPDSIKEKLIKFFKLNGNGNGNGTNGGLKVNGGSTAALSAANNPMNLVQKGANLAQLGMRNLGLLNMISEALTKKKFTNHVADTAKNGANNLKMTIKNPKQRAKDLVEEQKKLNSKNDYFKLAQDKVRKSMDNTQISTL